MPKTSILKAPLDKYLEEVKNQVKLLWENNDFKKWRDTMNLKPGDLILINNSFLLRTGKRTSKNKRYLCLELRENQDYEIKIAKTENNILLDFKKISNKPNEISDIVKIEEEISKQFDALGKIIFVLVGEKVNEEPAEAEINHKMVKKIIWDSSIEEHFIFKQEKLTVKDPYEDNFWELLIEFLEKKQNITVDTKLSKKIESSVISVKRKAYIVFKIPENNDFKGETFLSNFIESLDSDLNLYQKKMEDIEHNINDLLRISYNFLDDGIRLFKLISNICDLKPLILWGTIFYHILQYQELTIIPSLIPGIKVDLKRYETMIQTARNNKFHRLTNFRRTLQFALPEDAIKSPTLTIFSDFSEKNKKLNKLNFEDRELVEILTHFYRTEELILPNKFWEQNYKVMEVTNQIFKATFKILQILIGKEE